jgi:hypothetical protein
VRAVIVMGTRCRRKHLGVGTRPLFWGRDGWEQVWKGTCLGALPFPTVTCEQRGLPESWAWGQRGRKRSGLLSMVHMDPGHLASREEWMALREPSEPCTH